MSTNGAIYAYNPESIIAIINSMRGGSFQETVIESGFRHAEKFLNRLTGKLQTFPGPLIRAEIMFRTIPHLTWSLPHNKTIIIPHEMMQLSRANNDVAGKRDVYKLNAEILESDPSLADVKFRLPSIYTLAGLQNSWGFLTIPRSGPTGKPGSVTFSLATLAKEIMDYFPESPEFATIIADEYSRMWDHTNHDYLHVLLPARSVYSQVADNSPLKLANDKENLIPKLIPSRHPDDSFERWSVVLHKELNADPNLDAGKYFGAVKELQAAVAKNHGESAAQQAGEYLASVYLWPALLLNNNSRFYTSIEAGINELSINKNDIQKQICQAFEWANLGSNRAIKANIVEDFVISEEQLLTGDGEICRKARHQYICKVAEKNSTRGERAVSALLTKYGATQDTIPPLSNAELIRLKTAISTRGYQEGLHLAEGFKFDGFTTMEFLEKCARSWSDRIGYHKEHLPPGYLTRAAQLTNRGVWQRN